MSADLSRLSIPGDVASNALESTALRKGQVWRNSTDHACLVLYSYCANKVMLATKISEAVNTIFILPL